MAYDKSNIFAKILKGEIPAHVVYEDDYCLAFRDIDPKALVHVLVIPKGEYTDIHDFITHASQETIYGYFQGLKNTLHALNLVDNGFRVTANTGEHGGQEVPHFHMHICGGEKLPSPFRD